MSIVAKYVLALISVMGFEQLWTLSQVQDIIPNGLTQPPSKGIFTLNFFNLIFCFDSGVVKSSLTSVLHKWSAGRILSYWPKMQDVQNLFFQLTQTVNLP
jgi:hypothetical protein